MGATYKVHRVRSTFGLTPLGKWSPLIESRLESGQYLLDQFAEIVMLRREERLPKGDQWIVSTPT